MKAARTVVIAIAAGACVCAWPAGAQQQPGDSAAVGEPTAGEVLRASVKAVGGREAVDAVSSLHAVFVTEFGGQTVENVVLWSRDGGRIVRFTTSGGTTEMATDGTIKWRKGPTGYQLLEDQAAGDLNSQANLYMIVLDPARLGKDEMRSIEFAGETRFGTRTCHKLRFIDKNGKDGEAFFDASTGLPAGFRSTETNRRTGGDMVTTMFLSDWKEEKGVKFFRTVTIEQTGSTQPIVLRTARLEVNTLDATTFAVPEEVRSLAAQAASNPGAPIKLSDLTPEQQTQANDMINGIKQSGSADLIRRAVDGLRPAIQYGGAEQKKMYQYVVQELEKEIKRLGGE